jgi:hypothetical protein
VNPDVSDQAEPANGSQVYGELLKEELAEQEARRSSFEQRGLAVVTTAGTLVTLLFGLAALSTKAGNSKPFTSSEKLWLAIALVLFVAAAIAALLTNWPLKYRSVSLKGVREGLEAASGKPAVEVQSDVAFTRLEVLERARDKNTLKGRYLYAAMTLEVAAVACVGIAIFEVINP